MEERRGKGGGRDARRCGAGYVATRLEEEEEELDGRFERVSCLIM